MAFDQLPNEEIKQISPEEIRIKIENPEDPIHGEIARAVKSVSSRHIKDLALMEDLVQEVSLKVWRDSNNFKNTYSLFSWIYGIAKHTFLDYLRKSKVRHVMETDSLSEDKFRKLESNSALAEKDIISSIDSGAFWNFVEGKITSDELQLLEMKFREGMNFTEMALKLQTTQNVVMGKYYRLLRRIDKIIKEEKKSKLSHR